MPSGVLPSYDVDLYADGALADPYGHYRALRDLGPVVWLPVHDVYAVARDADVRRVLDDPGVFCSGQGVGLNEVINAGGRGTTLMSDGEQHARLREVIGRPLTPKALAELRHPAQALADGLADRLVARHSFDAVPDLAEVLPATWVPDLLGWPADGRDRLLGWASDTFDSLGPLNDRTDAAGPGLLEMTGYARQVASSTLPEATMAAGILAAAARGDIEPDQCPMAIIDYLGPSLDTTVAALGNAVWLFHPPRPVGPAPPRPPAGQAGVQRGAAHREPDQRLRPGHHPAHRGRRGRAAGRRPRPRELRLREPRRAPVGRAGVVRHHPQQRRPRRVRPR